MLIALNTSGKTTIISNNDADTVKHKRIEWANIGLGVWYDKNISSTDGLNLGVDYHWLPKRITYQVGFSLSSTLISGTTLNVIHAGIGKTIYKKYFLIGFIAGPGLMWGKQYDSDLDGENYIKAGLNINAQLLAKPFKNFGIGCVLFTNINATQNATGIRFVIHLNNEK